MMPRPPVAQSPFKDPMWADNNEHRELFLTWQLNDGLGVLVSQERASEEPNIVFCSLFDDPDKVFWNGLNRRQFGLSLSEARAVLDRIEAKFALRPLDDEASGSD
jgi:hypothetical protein